jgi:hypothetical protein
LIAKLTLPSGITATRAAGAGVTFFRSSATRKNEKAHANRNHSKNSFHGGFATDFGFIVKRLRLLFEHDMSCVRFYIPKLLFMLALATGCQVDRIKELKGQFKLNPESIDMGAHVIGTKSSAALTLENSSRFSVNFVVSSSNNSFVPKTDSNLSVTGTSSISIEFIPTQLGPVSADITIDIEGIQYVSKISGEGVPVPNCPNVNQCVKSVFSLTTESCVETLVADGTACSDVCLTDSFCKAGACVGTQKTCDDSNACTVDSCAWVSTFTKGL